MKTFIGGSKNLVVAISAITSFGIGTAIYKAVTSVAGNRRERKQLDGINKDYYPVEEDDAEVVEEAK